MVLLPLKVRTVVPAVAGPGDGAAEIERARAGPGAAGAVVGEGVGAAEDDRRVDGFNRIG